MIKKIIFGGIILLAIVLRFIFLANVPPSPSLDEATIGWNAYSILHTGRDEYGYFLPILLRAYDDYRPALYVYLVVPFIKVFGLNVISIRLPSVVMSIATVIMSYFLVKNIFIASKKKEIIALITMFLLAISPWHIYVSRLGHEVNLGLTLIVAGMLLFLLGIRKKNGWFLAVSFFTFGTSFYSYQSEKVFIPLLLIALFALFWRKMLLLKKQVVLGMILFILVSLPIFFASLTPQAMLRLKGTSVFTDNPRYAQSAKDVLLAKQNNSLFGEVTNNRRVITVEIFLQNYFSHFSPWWLFGNTGDEPFKAPNTGLMYLWEMPFLLLGLFFLFFSKEIGWQIKGLIILWILIDFVAPGLTTQAPHAMRAYTLLPVPQIIVALGIVALVPFFQKRKAASMAFGAILLVVVGTSLFLFIKNYFVAFPIEQSDSFQYALGKAIVYIAKEQASYKRIELTNKNNGYQSYMLYLYYTHYDPQQYLAHGGTKSGGFQEVHMIDNIAFQVVGKNPTEKRVLYVTNTIRQNASIKNIFYNLDGSIGLIAWTVKGE